LLSRIWIVDGWALVTAMGGVVLVISEDDDEPVACRASPVKRPDATNRAFIVVPDTPLGAAGPRDRRMSYDDDDDIHAFIRAREAAAGAGTSYGARGPHPRGPSNARRAAASRRALTGSDSSDGEYVPSPRKKSRGAGSSERRPPAPKALDEARAAKEDEKRRKQEERERGRKEKAAEKERQKAERQLGRAQKSMASAARRHEAVTVCISNELAAEEVGWRTMERLRSETPPIAYTVRASPLSPLPSLSWEYACEMRASVGPNGPHREAVRVQAFPYVMVVMEAALLCAHAEKDGLSGLVTRVQQRSPHATLALCVVGLATLTRQCQRQGRGDVPAKAEAALLRLAVTHPGVRVSHASDASEAGDHIYRVSLALSEAPYAVASHAHVLKSKVAVAGMYDDDEKRMLPVMRALMCVPRVAEDQANAVATAYPSLGALMSRFQDPNLAEKDKRRLLVGLAVPGRKTKTGPMTADKLRTFLTCEDPDRSLD